MENNLATNMQLNLANESPEEALKTQESASIDELSPLLSPSDSTTTLIPISPNISPDDQNEDPEAQHPSTPPSEDSSPPMTWRETGYVAFAVFSFFGVSILSTYLETSFDRLYFTKLAWYCVVVCMVMISIFMALFVTPETVQMRSNASKPSNQYIRLALFKLALMYWAAWLASYGMIWLWAVLKYPGLKQSALQMSRVWVEFQGKIEVKDAFMMLTSCLKDVEGNATVSDFGVCLREMGVSDG